MPPLVSIIIVNWNGKKWLERCILSLLDQTYQDFEIIFVDNASNDGSVDFMRAHFDDPRIKIVESSENLGFAGGNNLGLTHCKGKYIYLLNTDTESTKNSLKEIVQYLDMNPLVAIAQPKLLLMDAPDLHDAVASYWTYTTMLFYDGIYASIEDKRYNKELQTYTVKGAACLIRKTVIDTIGLFDDTYWCYFEETDFCHRCWLSGHQVMFAHTSPVYHAGGGASLEFENNFVQFHNFKNKLRTYIKNFSGPILLYVLPMHFLVIVLLSIFWIFKSPQKPIALWKSLGWNIINIKSTLQLRKKVQSHRKVKDSRFMNLLTKNPPLRYYFYLFINMKKYAKLR